MIPSVITTFISRLSDRQRMVVDKRFGLSEGEPQTLAAIGDAYTITRERVRQIESSTLAALRQAFPREKDLAELVGKIQTQLQELGGMVTEGALLDASRKFHKDLTTQHLIFLAAVSRKFHFHDEDMTSVAFFYSDDKTLKKATGFLAKLVKFLKSKRERMVSGESQELLQGFVRAEGLEAATAEQYVRVSKQFHVNSFGDFGLTEWAEIKPQTIRDRIYLVLKKQKEPLHFRKIAELINDFGLSKRMALVPTVHNELIKDNRFVLVGRGIYALDEHGFKPGTAREVIVDILKRHGALEPDQVVLAVQKERFFKSNTVVANLQNKKFFERLSDGRYQIRSA